MVGKEEGAGEEGTVTAWRYNCYGLLQGFVNTRDKGIKRRRRDKDKWWKVEEWEEF